MSTSTTITIGENGESLNGEMHLCNLRNYTARLSVFKTPLTRYAALPLAEFTALEQEHCGRVARCVSVLLGGVRTITALDREVFVSLSAEQEVELRAEMRRLRGVHEEVVVLLAKVRAVVRVLEEQQGGVV